ncbi:Centromere/kinetochore protein zw10 -like protein [Trichinella nativa]|uniref:Centromere/kinetochore protein zw10-like protein n=1 Tax=Trichinella nativa TaxID=6335 RepID=A0A0V1KXG2_9BILA|nr:Centromere/kinetochore protein zw10 -like protein [Trichinella nativa]
MIDDSHRYDEKMITKYTVFQNICLLLYCKSFCSSSCPLMNIVCHGQIMDSGTNFSTAFKLLHNRFEKLSEAMAKIKICEEEISRQSKWLQKANVHSEEKIDSYEHDYESELKVYGEQITNLFDLSNDIGIMSSMVDNHKLAFYLRRCSKHISQLEKNLVPGVDSSSLKTNVVQPAAKLLEKHKMECLRKLNDEWLQLFQFNCSSENVELRIGTGQQNFNKAILSLNALGSLDNMLVSLSRQVDEKCFKFIRENCCNFNYSIMEGNIYWKLSLVTGDDESTAFLQTSLDNFIEAWTALGERFSSIKLSYSDNFYGKFLNHIGHNLVEVVFFGLQNPAILMREASLLSPMCDRMQQCDVFFENLFQNGLSDACMIKYELLKTGIKSTYLKRTRDKHLASARSILTCKEEWSNRRVLIENNEQHLLGLESSVNDEYLNEFIFKNWNPTSSSSSSLWTFPTVCVSNAAYLLMKMIREILHDSSTNVTDIEKDEIIEYNIETCQKIIFMYKSWKYWDGDVDFFNDESVMNYVDTVYVIHCLLLNSMQLLNAGCHVRFPFLTIMQDLRKDATLQFRAYIEKCATAVKERLNSLKKLDGLLVVDCMKEYQTNLNGLLAKYEQWKLKWQQILPEKVCQAEIGQLINISLEFFCDTILKKEDITSNEAVQLQILISPFTSKCGALFGMIPFEELLPVSKSWERLEEILIILGSNLKTIEARWENGSGPLALLLTAEELRHLIRASFQNTKLRAEVLSKIK